MKEKYAELIKDFHIIPKTILEIGSRDGNDSEYLRDYFNVSEDNVFIVEPNPKMAEEIRLRYPNFKVFEVAISDKIGVLKFNQVNDRNYDPIGTSSLLNRVDGWYERFDTSVIDVNVITGHDLLSRINETIDLCKIDVEGLSYEVIESFGDKIGMINSFHIETEHHTFWENQKLHNDVCDLLKTKGYKMIGEIGNRHQSDTIWIKN